MSCIATVKYDKTLVRRALNKYMARRLGKSFVIAFVAGIAVLVSSFLADMWSWLLTLVAAILTASIAFLLFVYFARLRAAEGFFDKGDESTVTFEFTTEGVHTMSHLGSTDLKWTVFEEILKFQDIWLLVYARSGYMTLPIDQLTPDCCHFIEHQIATHRNGPESKV